MQATFAEPGRRTRLTLLSVHAAATNSCRTAKAALRLAAEQAVAAIRETFEAHAAGRQGSDERLTDGLRHQQIVRPGHDRHGAAHAPEHGADIHAPLFVAGPVEVERGVVAPRHTPHSVGIGGAPAIKRDADAYILRAPLGGRGRPVGLGGAATSGPPICPNRATIAGKSTLAAVLTGNSLPA